MRPERTRIRRPEADKGSLRGTPLNEWKGPKGTRKAPRIAVLFRVPYTEVFSNQLLDDLDKIWELRFFIPDPTDPSKCVVFAEK